MMRMSTSEHLARDDRGFHPQTFADYDDRYPWVDWGCLHEKSSATCEIRHQRVFSTAC
jgi:hypothetical protein